MPIHTSPSDPQESDNIPSEPPPTIVLEAKKDDQISLLDILVVLAERKLAVLGGTAVFAILAIFVSFVLPKSYTATVTIMPPQQNSSIGAALASQLGSLGSVASLAGGGLGIKNPNDMYVGMLKSRTLEDAMVENFSLMQEYRKHLGSDARKAFEQHATIDGSDKDGLIHISIDDRDPNRAATLANGYVEQFRKLSAHLAITEAAQRRLFFEQQLEQAKDNLADAEQALKLTEQKTGLIQLDSQARALIESAASMRAQIAAKEVQIRSMQTFAASENSQLIQAQQELESLRAQLAKLGGSESSGDADVIIPKGQMSEAGLEYVRKIRNVKYYETIFDILARQFEIAKLDEAKQGSVIQVVDMAVPPDKRSFPKRGLIVIVASAVGFLVSIFFVLLQAGLKRIEDDPVARRKLLMFRRALHLKSGSIN